MKKELKQANDMISIKGKWSYIVLASLLLFAVPFYFISSSVENENNEIIGRLLLPAIAILVLVICVVVLVVKLRKK